MNKRIISLITALFLFFMPALVFSAGQSTTHTSTKLMSGEKRMYLHEVTWVADDNGGAIVNITIPASDLKKYKGSYLYRVITDPGSPAPDEYDVVLNDAYGFDVMEGFLAARHATSTQTVETIVPVYGQLTAVFTNQATSSASGKIIFLFVW